jgi:hypothetical protein
MSTLYNEHKVQQLLNSYGKLIDSHIAYGCTGYLFTFMFDQIPGSDSSRLSEMKKQLTWFYGRLAKASVPSPSKEKWTEYLPRAILVPDFPVFKHAKQNLRDVTVNDGLHWHGLVLQHPFRFRFSEGLDVHIKKDPFKYLVGSIRHIDAQPIKSKGSYVTGYGMKALTGDRISQDDVLIFPRSVTELPCKLSARAAGELVTYDFQSHFSERKPS